jgi:hypothetical protein
VPIGCNLEEASRQTDSARFGSSRKPESMLFNRAVPSAEPYTIGS